MTFNYPKNASRVGTGLINSPEGLFDTEMSRHVAGALYEFTSFNFSSITSGRSGPSLAQALTTYDTATYSWLNDTQFFSEDPAYPGIFRWTVPATATYRMIAAGASGGDNVSGAANVGRGAVITADINLLVGQVLKILLGQNGEDGSDTCGAMGGGGGTFVATVDDTPILVAGGGGGEGYSTNPNGQDASLDTVTGAGTDSTDGLASGGTGGNGGGLPASAGCSNNEGSSGGGFFGNGATQGGNGSVQSGGFAFVNGGLGAQATSWREGGFGGGGGGRYGAGGGGGFSGGGAGSLGGNCTCNVMTGGGGGGSYINPTFGALVSASHHTAPGYLQVTKL